MTDHINKKTIKFTGLRILPQINTYVDALVWIKSSSWQELREELGQHG